MADDERFDGLYLNVAQTTRGIEPLLDTVFSFLRRKTDFFAGPPGSGEQGTDKAIAKVNEVLQKHAALYRKSKEATTSRKKVAPKAKQKTVQDEDVIEIGSDGKFDASEQLRESSKPAAEPKKAARDETTKPAATKKEEELVPEKMDVEEEDRRGPPPPGNGGTVEGKYVWTQLLSELVVTVPVPPNTRGRDLNVVIAKKHLKVGLRSSAEPIIDAPLTKAVICDDSFWTVEDGSRLVMNLQKSNQMEWWDSVCEGDPKIDVRAIQPESSSLST
jgi:CS domain/N-terminal conserved domain of Nudc.